MRRKFAYLTVVGMVLALAVPASSMAMGPAGAKFEIAGSANGPKLTTSLGSCSIGKITGQIPTNASEANAFVIPPPVPGTCTSGASATFSENSYSKWAITTPGGHMAIVNPGPEGITLRYASLPNCKLVGPIPLYGIWFNGTGGTTGKSEYFADSGGTLTWANDGGTCALNGKYEKVTYESKQLTNLEREWHPSFTTVNNLTTSYTPIVVP